MKLECGYRGVIKIFLDGADRAGILDGLKNPLIQGFTTNPTLMRQAGVKDYEAFAKDILTHVKKPISFEVFADEFDEMARQALKIKSWADNIYVKIPITNSKGASSIPLIRDLSHQGVKLNVTAVLTLDQVRESGQALKGGAPSIVSVFAGRIADAGFDPMPLMTEAARLCAEADGRIELLWASSREVLNLAQAELCGVRIITMTPALIGKIGNFRKDLGQFSLETVQMFKRDADAAGYRL